MNLPQVNRAWQSNHNHLDFNAFIGQNVLMRAAELIVDSLKAHGIRRVYCVPGESYLGLLDALYDSGIEVVVCRHEGGAGFMAVSEAKMTDIPGVVLVSRGPGATNVSIAVHMAEQDALPLLVLIGQVSREERTRGVFQEVDYKQFLGGFCKDVFEPQQGEKLFELMPRALRLATEGVAGPVAIAIPEDVFGDEVEMREALQPYPIPLPHHNPDEAAILENYIAQAERPLIIAGGRMRTRDGVQSLARFADANRIPVATTWKNQDIFDNTSRLYAGHIGFGAPRDYKELLSDADLIIAIGTRLGDIASFNYAFPQAPQPKQKFVHIYPDSRPIGQVTRPDLAIIADPAPLLLELAQSARVGTSTRKNWISSIHAGISKLQTFVTVNPSDGVDFGVVVEALAKHAPKDCVIVLDSGNAPTWVHRHWKMTPENMLIGAIVGAMGLGVPGAVAASFVDRQRMALAFVGDGSVMMTGQELAVAVAHGLTPKIVISDNGIYGTIRAHQEREFPGRISGTMLHNPDFTAWAKSFGADAFTIAIGDDVEATVKNFLHSKNAAVLHVKSSRQALSANGQLRA